MRLDQHHGPAGRWRLYLAALPFVVLAVAYFRRLRMRGLRKIRTTSCCLRCRSMAQAVKQMAFQADTRTGAYLMLADTLAPASADWSSALAISTVAALVLGIVIGLLPGANALLGPFVSVDVDGAAIGAAADPVHRHGPR